MEHLGQHCLGKPEQLNGPSAITLPANMARHLSGFVLNHTHRHKHL
jgi:hypothetical protein